LPPEIQFFEDAMSANDPITAHDEAHTGPIKTPKQLLAAVFFSFVVPVFAIIGLVFYVSSANKPEAGAADTEKALAQRIQKVGMVEIRDANRPLKSGEDVYKAQCVACHATGAAGAPKFGDSAAWAPRIQTGFEALWNSALKGKGAMSAQGGGDFADLEIGRAVVYMTAAAGGKFAEPAAPATTAAAPAADAAAAAPASPVAAVAVPAAASPAAPAATVATAGAGESLYKELCVTCHATGVAGSPKFGDKTAWAPRLATGLDTLTASVVNGKGAMPAKGGAATATEADIRAAVVYMTTAAGGKFAESAAPAAAAPAAPAKVAAAGGGSAAGEALYKQSCGTCHAAGIAGSPKFGDKAAWAPRIKTGLDTLTASAIKGKGAMPPKGGTAASDADIRSAVEYMVGAAK
jgi:cytochrome c5